MKKILFRILKLSVCLVLVMSISGCVPLFLFSFVESIVHPFNLTEHSNTKWVCNEMDMYFYVLDSEYVNSEFNIIGECVVDGETYRFTGDKFEGMIWIYLYSSEDITDSRYTDKNGDNYLNCNDILASDSYVQFSGIYKDDILELVVSDSDDSFWAEDVETLTFEKDGEIAKEVSSVWFNSELNMYIRSFKNTEGYYEGEIYIKDEKLDFYGAEVRNGGCYRFLVADEEEDDSDDPFMNYGQCELVGAVLEFNKENGDLVLKITDDYLVYPEWYPYWDFSKSEYIFKPTQN